MVEHLPCKQGVKSSNLLISTKRKNCAFGAVFCCTKKPSLDACFFSLRRMTSRPTHIACFATMCQKLRSDVWSLLSPKKVKHFWGPQIYVGDFAQSLFCESVPSKVKSKTFRHFLATKKTRDFPRFFCFLKFSYFFVVFAGFSAFALFCFLSSSKMFVKSSS